VTAALAIDVVKICSKTVIEVVKKTNQELAQRINFNNGIKY